MIHLVPKTGERLDQWSTAMWEDYHHSLCEAGFTEEEASANVERNRGALLVDGRLNADQHVFDALDGDEVVGTLWLAPRDGEGAQDAWYIYDIAIDPALRGRGLGRATMEAAEEYVRSRGATSLSLNVFGVNTVARALYESLGFRPLAINMRKDLD